MLWIEDPVKILLNPQHMFKVLPDKKEPVIEQVNSFARFLLWYGIIISLYNKQWSPLAIALMCNILVALFVKKQKTLQKYFVLLNKPEYECPTPTEQNPFANPSVGHRNYYNDNQNCAVDYNDPDVSDNINKLFTNDLPLDHWDIYGKNNSQRQFYSVIPNNQSEFAKWLYDPQQLCNKREMPLNCNINMQMI